MGSTSRLLQLYRVHMRTNPPRERLFLASVSFGLTFGLARAVTHAIRNNLGPFHNVTAGGTHLHHLVLGILLLLGAGYAGLLEGGGDSRAASRSARLIAIAFGIGAALTLDEFALWLNLQDVYWQRKGRESIDAVVVFASLLAAGIFGRPLVKGIAWEARAALRGVSEAERIAHLELDRIRQQEHSTQGHDPEEPVDRAP